MCSMHLDPAFRDCMTCCICREVCCCVIGTWCLLQHSARNTCRPVNMFVLHVVEHVWQDSDSADS
jgi:hypothetical protein